jgi:hypothetical protein
MPLTAPTVEWICPTGQDGYSDRRYGRRARNDPGDWSQYEVVDASTPSAPAPPPPALRDRIHRSADRVSALGSPLRRALPFVAVSAALFLIVAAVWGRAHRPVPDALLALGWIVHTALATMLYAATLRESIPGRLLSAGRLMALVSIAAAAAVASALTLFVLAPNVPPRFGVRALRVCLSREYGLGLVPLALAVWLSMHGLAARPILAGTLAGLGSGLLVESSWRLYCGITDPMHSAIAHAGAAVLLAVTGGAAGLALRALGRRRA